MGGILTRIKHLKRRWIVLAISLILFLCWYVQCIPKTLFDDPISLVLVDENKVLLGAHVSKDEQWRFPELDSVNGKFVQALLAYEDKRFYSHVGVDPLALARAIKLNIKKRRIVSGGSTVSMQVVRLSRKNPSRTVFEKVTEMFRATRLEMRYSKDEILQFYASHAPFGGNVVGLDAASWKYFGKGQEKLSWAEATMLAVLPNAPALIHPGRNRKRLKEKRDAVLDKLLANESIDSTIWELSKWESLPEKPVDLPNIAPHLLTHFLKQGKEGYLHSSIDYHLQNGIADALARNVENLKSKAVYNASCIIVEVKTGKVKAYVGNAPDAENRYENEVDMLRAERSSGSILKPLLFAEMVEEGQILPHTLVQDVPVDFHGYSPENYYLTYDGMVPANQMVSRSLNIPAVNLLNQYGVNKFVHTLKDYGFETIRKTGSHYGLPLILGGAEVSSWDLAKVYTGMAQKLMGMSKEVSVLKEEHAPNPWIHKFPNKGAIWKMMEAMLEVSRPNADKSWKVFGGNQKIAWKTGTSFGGRDAWAVACNAEYVVVVWAGNSDGEGRPSLTGFNSAAPMVFSAFNLLPSEVNWFPEPTEDLIEIEVCQQSGQKANGLCQYTKVEKVPTRGGDSEHCMYCKSIAYDSSAFYQVKNATTSPLNKVNKVYFVLNPLEEKYYKKRHASYVSPPMQKDKNIPLKITYPADLAQIYLPKTDENNRSKMIVKANSASGEDALFWTLDNKFLGKTEGSHQLAIQPEKGKHVLVVVNKKGGKSITRFEVVL